MQTKSTRGVQQHEVDAAADVLVAERQRPTIERVRQKLGRGSPNTIAPMLEAWFSTLAPRLGVATNETETGAMPAEVRGAAQAMWNSALTLAHAQAATTLQGDREVLTQERLDLAAENTALEASQAQLVLHEAMLREALNTAQNQAEENKQRVLRVEAELVRSNADLAQVRLSLGKNVIERDAERLRFDTQVNAGVQEREKQQERASSNERRLLEEVDRARQEARQVRSKLVAERKKQEVALGELERIRLQLSHIVGDNKVAMAALTEKLAAAERRVLDFQHALRASLVSTKAIPRKKIQKKRIVRPLDSAARE